jgi:DNA-directed RNA polymerase I, II, and III subunit RPABC2
MSDDEYYSDNNSDKSDSDVEEVSNKKPLFNIAIKKLGTTNHYDDSEPDDADSDTDEDNDNVIEGDDDDNDEDDVNQMGGVGDDDDDEILQDRTPDQSDDEDIELNEEGEPVVKETVKKTTKPKKTTQLIVEEDDDDYDDEYDENYLQKFDNDIMKNYVTEYHPECLNHNYDEITKLNIVVRNSDGIIIDPLHRTIPFLTKYERARVLGQRAKQIETGAKPLVKVPENVVDSYIIAELELKEKKIPFIIRRPIPGGGCEYWNLKDLEVIAY